MNKKYRITSKFRFTTFLVIAILCIFTIIGSLTERNTASSCSMDQYSQIVIESGDTLWDIALEYGSDDMDIRQVVYEICNLNKISADQLEAGQKIIIPIYS